MRAAIRSRSKQTGAILLMFGICLLLLFGLLGIVVDLGYAYTARASVQNAADSAALAGARELDYTVGGIQRAITVARHYAQRNKMTGQADFLIKDDDLWVGECPGDECMVPAADYSDQVVAQQMVFLKVRARSKPVPTFFMKLLSTGPNDALASTSATATAVAGRVIPPCVPEPLTTKSVMAASRVPPSGPPHPLVPKWHVDIPCDGCQGLRCQVGETTTLQMPTILYR
jgi:hypothetical protein